VKQIRKRLTYANVMSSMAVFLVLGGATAYAALGKNTVGSSQLKKNAVTTAKIKKNAVTSSKVANGSLVSGDFAAGQIPAGPQGPQGPAGSAKAWAVVSAAGRLVKSFNILSVSKIGTGLYCVSAGNGATTANSAALATLDWSDISVLGGDTIFVSSERAFNGCAPDTQFQVLTFDSSNALRDRGFDFMVP
jgi:hypothetical protein